MKFLSLNEDFLKNDSIRNLSKSIYHIMIDLLFLSFEWHHKPFFKTPKQIYSELNVNRMALNRALVTLNNYGIDVQYKNKKYYFDLTTFFDIYNPLSNKNVTLENDDNCNKTVTQNNPSVTKLISNCNKTVTDL
jgi:hypothetical protein